MSGAMLRLGHNVYGAAAWRDGSELRVYVRKDYGAIEIFDPANNPEQAWEVLAWLLRQDNCNEVNGAYVLFYLNAKALEEPLRIDHNGTPAGIRAAVVEAAVMVANA